ncbi:MAG: ABC transporter ATP-binding protein [Gammaproteobacteria bacterium]|nr:ABC transporter ATP-binding protein [Gammaproteobacteria bacterium]
MSIPYFNLLKAVWRNGKPWHGTMIGYYLAYIVAQVCLGLNPYAFGRTLDLLQQFTPDKLSALLFWLIFGVMLTPLFWLFHGPARVIERKVALNIKQTFLLHIYKKLTDLPLKWHQDHHSGDLMTRINRACTALYQFAGDQYVYIETVIKFLVAIGFLFWISFTVGLLSFLACVIAVAAVVLFDKKLIVLYERENEADNHVGAGLYDYISNMTTILTLRLGQLTEHNVFKRLKLIWPTYHKEVVINEVKWFTMNMMLTVSQAIILISYILYHLHSSDILLIGTVVMIFRYQMELGEVFYNLSTHYSQLVQMNTDVLGIQPILDDFERLAHLPLGASLAQQWHTLSITDLQFKHSGDRAQNSIPPMNLQLKRKEKIALIGSSGAGKSTLLNLLSGLYAPDSVQLTIDGIPFNSLEPMHAMTTLIPQEPEIFENTIAFNITMDLEATPKDIDEVIQHSGFADVLKTLPSGLATDIREKGLNFSVGQKQRLALARGLFAARFSSLILMDEPTSSVDLATEKKILSAMIKSCAHATLIVSLHRLHLLPKFNRIIMLHHGEIIADGPTTLLLNTAGPVKKLWEKYTKNHP